MILAGLTDRPAKYSGEAGENAEFWFHQLDRYYHANGVTDEDIKGDNLLGFLAGEARSFYFHSMWLNNGFSLTYRQLRYAFIKKFGRIDILQTRDASSCAIPQCTSPTGIRCRVQESRERNLRHELC